MIDPKERKKEEDKYFKAKESEMLKKMQSDKEKQEENKRLQALKDLHWMHCPKCGQDLEERSLDEIKIDVCTSCDGIWLDKGELDSLRTKEGFIFNQIFKIFK